MPHKGEDRLPTVEEYRALGGMCNGPTSAKEPECRRAPITFTGGFSDMYLCEGHLIIHNANGSYRERGGITRKCYLAEFARAQQWFRENPNPEVT